MVYEKYAKDHPADLHDRAASAVFIDSLVVAYLDENFFLGFFDMPR